MGDFSYGIYIYAFPVQQLAAYFGAVSPWSNMLWSAPAVLILSALSWHLIEEPVLRLKPRGRVATRVESA
jgi:peptidoglycan/LPS O-acetylase OafA/YrhL